MSRYTTLIAPLKRPWVAFFARRTGRVTGGAWTELGARRVFILPTRAGLGFAALLMVLLLGAINYNNNLIFALTFLLAGLGLVTMLHTYRNLVHLKFQAGQGHPGFVGERIGFQIWLRPGDGRPSQAVELRTEAGHSTVLDVGAAATSAGLYRIAFQRGRLPLGQVTVATRYPLGLFRAWSRLDFTHAEPVYPAPAAPGLPPPRPASNGRGEVGNVGAGQDDYRGLRPYHPGDSMRRVDWKALAREQGLLTKEFAAAQTPEDWLDFVVTPEVDVEARLRRLCRWVLDAERGRGRYGLRLPGLTIAPARGTLHRDRCLLALADFGGSA